MTAVKCCDVGLPVRTASLLSRLNAWKYLTFRLPYHWALSEVALFSLLSSRSEIREVWRRKFILFLRLYMCVHVPGYVFGGKVSIADLLFDNNMTTDNFVNTIWIVLYFRWLLLHLTEIFRYLKKYIRFVKPNCVFPV